MATSQLFPIRLTNLMKVPETKSLAEELLASLQKTLVELENPEENPCLVFKQNMEEGFLFPAALKDASNAVTVYANIYQSIIELKEILELKKWD
ncbi:MAG: hypothetical protein GW938_04225 [Leptospira sp.]|nr:hypothetical protein [Leptospira sp.]NCS92346.1 hypothetical protein [Leptospira sp.]